MVLGSQADGSGGHPGGWHSFCHALVGPRRANTEIPVCRDLQAASVCTHNSITQPVCERKNGFSLLMTPLTERMAALPQGPAGKSAGEGWPSRLCLPQPLLPSVSLKQRCPDGHIP